MLLVLRKPTASLKKRQELDVSPSSLDIFSEPKLDGLAISIHYDNGLFSYAATRGDGQGAKMLPYHKTVKSVPIKLATENPPKKLDVRGEVFMPKAAFEKLNRLAVKMTAKVFVNREMRRRNHPANEP